MSLYKQIVVFVIIILLIGVGIFPINTVGNLDDQLDQYQQGATHGFAGPAPYRAAQSFKPTLNTLTRVKLKCFRDSGASGNIIVSIRKSLSGNDLTLKSIPVSSLPIDYPSANWIEFDFSDILVTVEDTYYIVWTPTSDDDSELSWWVTNINKPYDRGSFWQYWSYWSETSAYDATFETYGYNQQLNQPPEVNIDYPNDEDTVFDILSIQGTASDSDGVIDLVQVKIDSGSWETATGTLTWSYYWDTSTVIDGEHTISAKSYDGEDYSNVVMVNVNVANQVNQPPTVEIIWPEEEEIVSGAANIYGEASDPNGNETLVRVEVRIDDKSWNNATGEEYWNYSWNTAEEINGIHTIFARGYDGELYSDYSILNVTVQNAMTEYIIDSINGGFRVNANVKNIGTSSAFDIDWSIDLEGRFIFLGGHSDGIIDELGADDIETIRLSSLFGIGPTTITVTVGESSKQATGFILGPLVLNVREI